VIAAAWWKALLDGLGQVLAFFYEHVPGGYGVAIILLTVAIRVVLLPLGIKQIRSMQAMQAVQPKVKQLQAKYKGKGAEGRQKLNEEMMALYKEQGVNPLSGCLPLLAQFPVLIALFAVLRVPAGLAHLPPDSRLDVAVRSQHTSFLGTNLLCSAQQAGSHVHEKPVTAYGKKYGINGNQLNCGNGVPSRIPYYVFAIAMIGTTYYQQRQMQNASPQGSQQQQALTKFMPLLFGVWGFLFPAGLVVYWTTTNLIQIAQQQYMLPRVRATRGEPPTAGKKTAGELRELGDGKRPAKRGQGRPARPRPQTGRGRQDLGARRPGSQTANAAGSGESERSGQDRRGTRNAGSGQRGSGGSRGGDRKKRRKR
jgi:YidC/Oxa1 family membrane protein insertase